MTLFNIFGNYELDGEEITREEFIRRGFPQIFMALLAFGSVWFGISLEKAWSRYAVIALFIIPYPFWIRDTLVLGISTSHVLSALIPSLGIYSAFVGLVYYYLFKWPQTVSYYNDLTYESNKADARDGL